MKQDQLRKIEDMKSLLNILFEYAIKLITQENYTSDTNHIIDFSNAFNDALFNIVSGYYEKAIIITHKGIIKETIILQRLNDGRIFLEKTVEGSSK